MGSNAIANTQYREWLKDLKQRYRQAQLKASVRVNSALLQFYWELGADIVEKQKNAVWGSGFLKQLCTDLSTEFPGVAGFSYRNVKFIRQWYLFYFEGYAKGKQPVSQLRDETGSTKGKQPVSQMERADFKDMASLLVQIPWGHNIRIVQKCSTVEQAIFYVCKTIENGWSRAVLMHQIESGLHDREGKAITNFSQTLPVPQSDLAQQIIKDPYNFDFLTLTESFNERQLDQSLTDHITKFLLELGAGFAYVGKQVHIPVGERDFFLDLLFYHTQLHCYVVIELKTGEFEPEHAGKLNFYIKAVDEQHRQEGDNATIGILLCKKKDRIVAEYALSDINKPMGVSEYQLTHALPDDLRSSLPSIEEIEAELSGGSGS